MFLQTFYRLKLKNMNKIIAITPIITLMYFMNAYVGHSIIEPETLGFNSIENVVIAKSKLKGKKHPLKVTFKEATEREYNNASINQDIIFEMKEGDAKKIDGVIHLKINEEWKAITSLKDEFLSEFNINLCTYYYLGKSNSINAYLIGSHSFFDEKEWYLVDAKTAEVITVTSNPIFSPNYLNFATLNLVSTSNIPLKGFYLSKLNKTNSVLEASHYYVGKNEKWIPYELFWETNNSLLIKVLPEKKSNNLKNEPLESDFSYVRMTIKN
tara:strand:- start:97915 stop:98721 length:807 start_codon:yes stop_codon:yes gene_type:complete